DKAPALLEIRGCTDVIGHHGALAAERRRVVRLGGRAAADLLPPVHEALHILAQRAELGDFLLDLLVEGDDVRLDRVPIGARIGGVEARFNGRVAGAERSSVDVSHPTMPLPGSRGAARRARWPSATASSRAE